LRVARVIAVVRADTGKQAVGAALALAAGGLQAIELTFTTPDVETALADAHQRLGGSALLGAGTITTSEQLEGATAAGADFLVTPHLEPALLEAMLGTGLLSVPGVLTPSEVAGASRLGASVVKLFPASTVGVGHLRALFGPFPGLQVIPTGGISPSAVGEWLSAGALAVGLGGELLPKALVRECAWDEVARNASEMLAGLRTHG
jgi:2-dehydro-3-deoxyphosphogluconate aldolase/(4S)-4-hydroxy-2-oxoglutarate aldolase